VRRGDNSNGEPKPQGARLGRLVGIERLAEELSVSTHTIYAWVAQRRIPFIKVGRLLRFDLDAIERWLGDHSVADDGNLALERNLEAGIIASGCGTRPGRR
jgi:excisionase family DNA binding protein